MNRNILVILSFEIKNGYRFEKLGLFVPFFASGLKKNKLTMTKHCSQSNVSRKENTVSLLIIPPAHTMRRSQPVLIQRWRWDNYSPSCGKNSVCQNDTISNLLHVWFDQVKLLNFHISSRLCFVISENLNQDTGNSILVTISHRGHLYQKLLPMKKWCVVFLRETTTHEVTLFPATF